MTQAIVATPETANNSLTTEASSEEKLLWTSADLELMPDNDSRYEIINGELYVTRALHNKHQKNLW